MKRLLIIGWDGADWDIIGDLVRRGALPAVARMIEEGARAHLMSTMPYHSWTAWPSFLTGVNPGRHGVFDFVERDPSQPGRRAPLSSSSIKATTFLKLLSGAGYEVRAGNIPVTFPPDAVRGRMISGVAIPPRADFAYPKGWAQELEQKAPFPLNGMEWAGRSDSPEALVDEAVRFAELRTRSFELLLEGDWTVAVCVYLASDRMQHPFGAYLLPSHPEYPSLAETPLAGAIRNVYTVLDGVIDRLRSVAGTNATTILMSDHGFRPISRATDLDRILQALGMASRSWTRGATTAVRRSTFVRAVGKTRFGPVLKRRIARPSTLDWSKTIAYAATSGAVSLNLAGREAKGVVEPSQYDPVREEVRGGLLGFEDPETGGRPIAHVHLREELYEGPYLDLAPDLLVEPAPGWDLTHKDVLSAPTAWPSAAHRRAGILVASGPEVAPADLGSRDITDLAATALAFSGLDVPELDGRIIEELVGQPGRPGPRGPSNEPSNEPARAGLSEGDQEVVTRHLRGLGYIE